MKGRLALAAALVVTGCSGAATTPLPGGLPPEYEPGRPFPSAAPAAAASPPAALASATPAAPPAASGAPAAH